MWPNQTKHFVLQNKQKGLNTLDLPIVETEVSVSLALTITMRRKHFVLSLTQLFSTAAQVQMYKVEVDLNTLMICALFPIFNTIIKKVFESLQIPVV